MALGKRRAQQQSLLVATTDLPRSPGHPFYRKLNELLAEAGFDRFAETLCAPFYEEGVGRPSIPPGVYFRMTLIGYFEGLDSQRGIAWRCSDSLSLREFLGLPLTQKTPDHSSLTRVRQRLPLEVHQELFAFVVKVAREKGLVRGQSLGVDTTTLEANAAMKSIVRKDTGEDWKAYLRRLAQDQGIEDPSDEDLRRQDRGRPDKKVSNDDWQSPSDPDARIAKMKDGRTDLAYKAQHAVDLDTEIVLAATIHPADAGDAELLPAALVETAGVLTSAGAETPLPAEVAADKGYHKSETLAFALTRGVRTYIPAPRSPHRRRWTDKPAAWRTAYHLNRRRVAGARGKRLQRRRSERVERSFAHTCGSGRARRTWLRGLDNITKRYVLHVAAHNLGRIFWALFGCGTPRSLAGASAAWCRALGALCRALGAWLVAAARFGTRSDRLPDRRPLDLLAAAIATASFRNTPCSTGC